MKLTYDNQEAVDYVQNTDKEQLLLNYEYNQARGYNFRNSYVKIPEDWNATWDKFPVNYKGYKITIGTIRNELNILSNIDKLNRATRKLKYENDKRGVTALANQRNHLFGQRLRINNNNKIVTQKETKSKKEYKTFPLLLEYQSSRQLKALLFYLIDLLREQHNINGNNTSFIKSSKTGWDDKTIKPFKISKFHQLT